MRYTLDYYTGRVKGMTDAELHYARLDVNGSIALWDKNPGDYRDRLYNEKDAILTEIQKRKAGTK